MDLDKSFEIDQASCVDEGLSKLANGLYDVVISDYEMPKKDGLQFLKELREQKTNIPFILFTGKGREEVAITALNLGADGYYNKQGTTETVYGELYHAIRFSVKHRKAEQEILEQKLKADRYLNVVGNIVLALDLEGKITLLNKKAYEILGYEDGELEGKNWLEMCIPKESQKELRSVFKSLVQGKEVAPVHYENSITTKKGEIRTISWYNTKVENGEGLLIGTLSSGEDVTERKKAEQILRESEASYRELANSMPNIVYESDLAGKVDYINERALEIAGISKGDFEKGLNIMQFLVPEDRERAAKSMQRLLAGGDYIPAEYEFLRKDGTTFPALIATSLRVSKNKVTGLRGLVINITEQKKVENLLKKSEERYKELANFLPETVFETDLTGKITFFSKRAFEITGFSQKEFEKGLNLLSFVVPEERERAKENLKKALNGEEHGASNGSSEYTLLQRNGSTYPAIVKSVPIICERKVTGLRGLVIDITDRKKIEQTIKESEEKFRKAFETSPDACYIGTLEDGVIVEVNDAFSRIWGYTREECLGKTSLHLGLYAKGPPDRQRMLSELKLKGHFSNLEFDGRRKNGEVFPLLFSGTILETNGKRFIYGILQDITERKKNEAALVQECNKFKSVTKAIGAGLVIINKDYRVVWANDFIKQYKGDAIGKLCHATLNNLDTPCLDCGVSKIFAGITTLDSHEYCSTTVDGTPYWVEIVATPIKDEQGNITSAVEIALDITERKKAEERRKVLERKVKNYSEHLKCMVDLRTAQLKDANERLVKSERFSAIGELAGMIGHDLRNPLAGIKNATYYLKKKGQTISEAQTKEMIEIIDKAIDHSDKIINDLLDYSREMHLELTKYSAYTLVDETLEMIKVPDRIKIVNRVQQDNWIWVNEDKMRRVFINLVKNAIDAMPEKGTLEIYSCPRNDCVEIVFADSGVGIPEEIMQKLFTPLFTTKAQGMGFGLAICKRIIEAHGGTIKVKSKVNKGTTFIIRLPPTRN